MSVASWQVLSATSPTPMRGGPCPPNTDRYPQPLTSRPASPGGPAKPGGPMGPGGPRSPGEPEGPCLPGSPCGGERTEGCQTPVSILRRRGCSRGGCMGELDPGGGPSIISSRGAPQVLTEGPGRPGNPLSPLCPGRPTTPRWPAIPWGPGVPGAPCGDKRHLRVVAAVGGTLLREGTTKGCWAAGGP